jgi:hypothetical protein
VQVPAGDRRGMVGLAQAAPEGIDLDLVEADLPCSALS